MKKKLLLFISFLFIGIGLITAQTKEIKGVVISEEDGLPIVGASVLVKGTSIGTITDIDGKYRIGNVPENAKTLVISYVGMRKTEVAIKKGLIETTLEVDTEVLEEVVVTGYGVTKKAAFTGAASTISSKSITDKTDANPIKALEGTVSGLQLNMSSGQPGAPANIFIRGRSSINSGTQPLYVIDGVPISADAIGIRGSEGQQISPLSTLNSNDIESITVLKDATATSIYGARAANGVIVINTKKGKAGKTKVNFTAKVGVQMMPNSTSKYDLVNADQYSEMWREALRNDLSDNPNGTTAYYMNKYYNGVKTDDQFLDFFLYDFNGFTSPKGTDVNWIDQVTRNSMLQEYSLDLQGGGSSKKAAKYYLSFNYLNDEAIVVGKDLERYSLRFNMEQTPSKYVSFGFNTNLSYTESNMGAGGGYFSDPITQGMMQSPLTAPRNEDGSWNFDTVNGYNPVAQRSQKGDKSTAKQYRALISPYVRLNFNDNLFFMSRGGADIYLVDEYGYWSFLQPQGKDMRGMGENGNTHRILLTLTNTLNYIKTFNEKHNVNFLVGQEVQYTNLKDTYLSASNYAVDYLNEVTNAAVPGSASTSRRELALASFFANAQYDYNNKYYLSGSFRYDGSSRFGSNNRWAPFWSLGAKYRISSEPFMEGTSDWLKNLTLRASYGTSGNQEVGEGWYASRNLFGFGYNYNGIPGSGHDQFGNPDLRWEQTNKFNVGFDVNLFSRINLELDYYYHKTSDMVFAVPVSKVTGLSSYYKNIGELENKGIEATLNAKIIESGKFNWNATFTISHNKNEVLALSNKNPIEGTYQITEAGKPLYQFYLQEYAGVDPQTGEAQWYKNKTGDEVTSKYTEASKRYLGSANPDIQGSFSNTIHYGNFDFSLQLNYSLGGKIYGNNLRYDEQIGGSFGESFNKYVYDNRWKEPGQITDVPKLSAFDSSAANKASSRFLMKGDYLKIRSITLGYSLPKAFIAKAHMSNVRAFIQADNLYTFCSSDYRGFDPSGIGANGVQWWNYPMPRNVMFGVTVGF